MMPLRSAEDFAGIRAARMELLHAWGHVPQLEKACDDSPRIADFMRALKNGK